MGSTALVRSVTGFKSVSISGRVRLEISLRSCATFGLAAGESSEPDCIIGFCDHFGLLYLHTSHPVHPRTELQGGLQTTSEPTMSDILSLLPKTWATTLEETLSRNTPTPVIVAAFVVPYAIAYLVHLPNTRFIRIGMYPIGLLAFVWVAATIRIERGEL